MLREVETENELIKKLVKQLDLPNFVIFIDTQTNLIEKRSERRKNYQNGYIYTKIKTKYINISVIFIN